MRVRTSRTSATRNMFRACISTHEVAFRKWLLRPILVLHASSASVPTVPVLYGSETCVNKYREYERTKNALRGVLWVSEPFRKMQESPPERQDRPLEIRNFQELTTP